MNFNKHSNLVGLHAFLGASDYHWLNDDPDKLRNRYLNYKARELGTRYHNVAKELIELKIKQPKTKTTFNMYVNDAIGFNMTPEQPLIYSENCYGTADAICFNENKSRLRIHDLKTGKTPASMNQLLIYASLFCLEYDFKPGEIETILRIYKNDEVKEMIATASDLTPVMNKIITADKIISKLKMEA